MNDNTPLVNALLRRSAACERYRHGASRSHYFAEGEIEEANRAAKAGDCTDDLWLKLAALRIRTDPAESLAIYQRLIRKSLSCKARYSAGQAKKLLYKTRRLMKRLCCDEEYEEFLVEIGRVFGTQRNLAILMVGAVK